MLQNCMRRPQDMWRDVSGKELRTRLKPGLAWLEILS